MFDTNCMVITNNNNVTDDNELKNNNNIYKHKTNHLLTKLHTH